MNRTKANDDKEDCGMEKRYDFLTPYEEAEKDAKTKQGELTDREKAYKKQFLKLLFERNAKQPNIIDPEKRNWLEKVAYPYFVELAETNFMRVELDIDENRAYGKIICTALEFILYDNLWMDWEEMSEIISKASDFSIFPKDNYVIAKLAFPLYEGDGKGIEEIMAEQQSSKKQLELEKIGFTQMFELPTPVAESENL